MTAPGSARPFVPGDFSVPGELVTAQFRLEPLGPQHNDGDYEAWTSSMAHIRATPGFADWSWPTEMTSEENLGDLRRHAEDFAGRTGFTYTVLDPRRARRGLRLHLPRAGQGRRSGGGCPGSEGAPSGEGAPAGKALLAGRALRLLGAPRAWPTCAPGSVPTGPNWTCRCTLRSPHGWPAPGRSRRSATRRATGVAAEPREREP